MTPKKLITLSETDVATLTEMARVHRYRYQNSSVKTTVERDQSQSPDVYIGLTSHSGIPALNEAPGTGTYGSEDRPGQGECDIFRIDNTTTPPSLVYCGFSRDVYNMSDTAIEDVVWVLLTKEKFGAWIATPTNLSGFGCESLQGFTGYSGLVTQILGHDASGNCTWFTTEECSSTSAATQPAPVRLDDTYNVLTGAAIDTWQDVLHTTAAPFQISVEAGEWSILGDISPELRNTTCPSGSLSYIVFRLYNVTAGAVVDYSQRMGLQSAVAGDRLRSNRTFTWQVSPTVVTTYKLQAKWNTDTTGGAVTVGVADCKSNADGYSYLYAEFAASSIGVVTPDELSTTSLALMATRADFPL